MRKERALNPRLAAVWTIVLVVSIVAFYFGSINMFASEGSFQIDFELDWYWMLATIGGIFFLLVSIWQLSADQISSVSSVFARISIRRIGPIVDYIPKSIHANTRNVKNLIGFLTLGVALVTSLNILSSSILIGNESTNRSYLGGDITMYFPFMHRSVLPSINAIPGVITSTVYTGVVMDSWSFNFDKSYSYVVNTADVYGGKHDNITESLNIVIIEPSEYIAMNPPVPVIVNEFDPVTQSIYEIEKPNPYEDPADFIRRLDTPMTTIICSELLGTLGKDIGDTISVSINGFMGMLQIVGSADNLPAAPYMRIMDQPEAKFMTRSLVISRSTFASMLGDFIGGVDIMVKNMTLPETIMNRSVSGSASGYTSGFINMGEIAGKLSGIASIDKVSYRFSTFAPGVPSLNATFNPSQLVWKHANVTISEGEEFPLPLRMFVVDGREDLFTSGWQQQVSESSAWAGSPFGTPGNPYDHTGDWEVADLLNWTYQKSINTTASNILYLIDKYLPNTPTGPRSTVFGNSSTCVTNRYVVAYEDIDNETYVYEMKPLDTIKFSIPMDDNTTKSTTFKIAATIDNHLSYWWQNGSMREGFKLSSKALNYNFKSNESSDLQDLFDVDANVFITTRGELGYAIQEMFGVPYFVGIDELDGVQANEIANHVQIKAKAGSNVTETANLIRSALATIPNANFSVIEYKRAFIDKLANSGALSITIDLSVGEETMLDRLESWFIVNGYTWDIARVGTRTRQNFSSDIGVAQPVFRIFFVVAIFSLLISAVGLCTILYANARKRHREFGIYKAIGYSNAAIREMIFFETFMVTSIGIVSGTIAGIAMMGILFQSIKSSLIMPVTFAMPIWSMASTVIMLFAISYLTSRIIATHVARLSIAENIRYRE